MLYSFFLMHRRPPVSPRTDTFLPCTSLSRPHQVVQPRITIRLDDRDHPVLRALSRRRKHRANLRRVVAVIVEHRHRAAVDRHLAYLGEATLDPAEPGKALPDLRIVDAE